jgi:hypothetical protein
MKAATVAAAAATGVSVFYGAWPRQTVVKPARLDLLRKQQKNMFRDAIWRARIGLGLLLLAVAFAITATWPTGGGKSASATIGSPTVTAVTGGMKRVSVTVTWSDLDTSVASVSSTITGSQNPTVTSKSAEDSTIEQPLDTEVPVGAMSVRVDTRALDAQGQQVHTGYTMLLTLPAGS